MDRDTLVESYEHAGFTVEIHHDVDYPSDDALDMSRVATIVIEHRRYVLGDEQHLPEFERECEACEGSGSQWVAQPITLTLDPGEPDPTTYHEVARLMLSCADRPLNSDEIVKEICGVCHGNGTIPETPVEFYKRTEGARVVIPLHVREDWNPSLIMGATNEVDESADGYAYDTPAAVKECLGYDVTDEQIAEAVRADVRVYSDAMHSDVYGFIVKDENGEEVEDGSVWGFIGDDLSYVKSEAESAARYAAQRRDEEAQERFAWACRDVETVA